MSRHRVGKILKLALECFLIVVLVTASFIAIYYVHKFFFAKVLEAMIYV
ncbi:MAG: hypothetical protein LZ173_03600 [Thaumarchaeota archaeon]|jgi:hypothetical protein|nr:hypothetical protein [Candidatus Geocrenenecus arthurdayi]